MDEKIMWERRREDWEREEGAATEGGERRRRNKEKLGETHEMTAPTLNHAT